MPRLREPLFWTTAAVGLVSALVLRWSPRSPTSLGWHPVPSTETLRPPSAESLAVLAQRLVDADPFRLERRPASAPFEASPAASAPAPPAAGPPLVVLGIVGGPPWEAVIEGIPGRDGGVVVRQGDAFGLLRIRSVGRDTVIVRGADTTWKLGLKRTW